MKLRPKPEQSRKYFETLSTKQNFLFTAFDDDQDRNKPSYTFYGTFDEHYPQLTALNNQGYGIFVCVNETAGISRKKGDIVNIRAVWIESDSGEQIDTPIQPSLVVESSPGKFHKYFLVTGMTAFQQVALQELLVRDFHSDPNATDLSRVLRLPGFYHQKKSERKGLIGEPWMVRIVEVNKREPYEAGELMTAFVLASNLDELIQQNQKVSRLFLGLASKLEACRKHLINPEHNQLDDKTRNQILTAINLFELGDRCYQAGITFYPVKAALESISAGNYSQQEVDDALAAIDSFMSFVPAISSSQSLHTPLISDANHLLTYLWPDDRLANMQVELDLIDSEDRNTWLAIGWALKRILGDGGFELWDVWSGGAPNYEQCVMRRTWDSLEVDEGDATRFDFGFKTIYSKAEQSLYALIDQAIDEVRA